MTLTKEGETNLAKQFRDKAREYTIHIRNTALNLTEMADPILKNHAPAECPERAVKHTIPDEVTPFEGNVIVNTGRLTITTLDIRQGNRLEVESWFMCVGESNNHTCDNCKIKERGVLIK